MKKLSLVLLFCFSLLLVTGCGKKTAPVVVVEQVIENGDTVAVNYTLSVSSGEVKDTSFKDIAEKNGIVTTGRTYEPLVFTLGQKKMIPGFEQGVLGMKANENKKITVDPEQWYGTRNDKLIQMVSGSVFKDAGIAPKVGDVFNFQFAPGKVLSLSGDMIEIDFNHPLAGETLTFDVTIVSITKWGSGAVQNPVQ